MEPTVNTNAKDISRLQSDTKTLFKNQDRHEDKHEEIVALLHNIDVSVGMMSQDRLSMQKAIEDVKKDVKEHIEKLSEEIEKLKDRPRNRWESLVTIVLSVVVSAVVGYFLSKTGL